jgi:hypothetical protein
LEKEPERWGGIICKRYWGYNERDMEKRRND